MGKAAMGGGFFFFIFYQKLWAKSLQWDTALPQKGFNSGHKSLWTTKKTSEPENSALELFSPERPLFHFRVVFNVMSSQSVQNKISCPTTFTLFSQVRFLYLEKSQGFSTGRLWEGISIPAWMFTIFGRHKTLCQVSRREITTQSRVICSFFQVILLFNTYGSSGLDNYLPIHLFLVMSSSGMQCWNSCDGN